MCRGQCKKSSLEHKLQFPTWLSMTKDCAKSFNKIRFSKNGVSSYVDKEGDIGFLQWRTDINMSKFAVVSKKYFTKFRPGQKPSETKGIAAHDDVTCPICWNNCQKCVILGKSSKHVRFIFVSFLSQKTDLSLEGGGDGRATTVCHWRLSWSQVTVSDNITLLAPWVAETIGQFVGQRCWRLISSVAST